MDFAAIIDGVESFAAYVGELASVIGHVGRVAPLHDYCAGLLASEGRRSVEPMAALTAPAEVSVQHQRLLHFVGEADWSDARVLMKACLSGCNPQPLGLVFGHAHGRSPAWRSSAPTIAPRISATFSRRRGLRRLLGEDSLERRVHLPPLSGGGRAVPLR